MGKRILLLLGEGRADIGSCHAAILREDTDEELKNLKNWRRIGTQRIRLYAELLPSKRRKGAR